MMRPLLLAACAQALITPSPVRPVATRLRARTADGMSKGWKVLRLSEEEGNAISLAANSNEWGTKEIEVEIPRSAESPGIGILLEEFGANDAGEGLTLVAGPRGACASARQSRATARSSRRTTRIQAKSASVHMAWPVLFAPSPGPR